MLDTKTATGEATLVVDDLHVSVGGKEILQGVDLGIPEGMITVIVGPSGTGKSVMIKHLIGLMFPDQGDVIVHGESLRNMTLSRLLDVRKKFGILFQDGAKVKTNDVLLEWDPYTFSILTEVSGVVHFKDLVDGLTLQEQAMGLAADLHLTAALPVARYVEFLTPSPYMDDLITEPFRPDPQGLLHVPTAAGLGVQLNRDALKRFAS